MIIYYLIDRKMNNINQTSSDLKFNLSSFVNESSLTSSRADSTDFPLSLLPSVPIVHRYDWKFNQNWIIS